MECASRARVPVSAGAALVRRSYRDMDHNRDGSLACCSSVSESNVSETDHPLECWGGPAPVELDPEQQERSEGDTESTKDVEEETRDSRNIQATEAVRFLNQLDRLNRWGCFGRRRVNWHHPRQTQSDPQTQIAVSGSCNIARDRKTSSSYRFRGQ